MSAALPRARSRIAPRLLFGVASAAILAGTGVSLLALLLAAITPGGACALGPAIGGVVLGPAGSGQLVGASEYGGPGDPSSGTVGASGQSLIAHPDTYAELGGTTFQTAIAMGGLPYMTPLRISWGSRSAIAYKRDFGLGGGPVQGVPRVLDLWWRLAAALGIPYRDGLWSGAVRISRPPVTGSAGLLGQPTAGSQALAGGAAPSADAAACGPAPATGVPITAGPTARLLGNGQAAAPAGAPAAVKAMIAAGNQIEGKPYLYGGGHGLPLSAVAPAYDCSSSVEHLLYLAGLLPVDFTGPSAELERYGVPGQGRWITLYVSADHVFMYVASLRWDTHDAAGPGDGSSGIGWHPLIRDATGFVARHPAGL